MRKSSKGFTLIELIVVLAMLGILFTAMIAVINPSAQINKAQDSQREHGLDQVKQALDTYYNDNGCYPTSFTFGQSWISGSTTYMENVPQDPKCNGTSSCFSYEVDKTSTCPQWNILYAGLESKVVIPDPCPLSNLTSCLPQGFSSSGYNYCVLSGKIDCSYVSSNPIPGASVGGGGGATATPTPTSGPTPTPGCPSGYWACTGNPSRCNNETYDQCTISGHGSQICYCSYDSCLSVCGQ